MEKLWFMAIVSGSINHIIKFLKHTKMSFGLFIHFQEIGPVTNQKLRWSVQFWEIRVISKFDKSEVSL